MVKNCFSKAVLFCVPAQVTTHTHYLLMQLICTSCVTWSLPPLLPVLVLCCVLQVRQDWTRGGNRKYCRVWKTLYIPKWFACSLQLLKFLIFNRELHRFFFFFAVSPLFPIWGELEHFTSRKVSRNIAHLAALTGMNTIMKSWSDISTDFAKKNHAIKF